MKTCTPGRFDNPDPSFFLTVTEEQGEVVPLSISNGPCGAIRNGGTYVDG